MDSEHFMTHELAYSRHKEDLRLKKNEVENDLNHPLAG